MTFDTHPLKVLHPKAAPRLLTSTPHKLRLLKALGVQGCIVIPFTRSLARQEPKAFIARLALAAPTLRQIVIGRNWTFGRQGHGTPAMLETLAPDFGFKVTVIPPVRWRGTVVSSTRIRTAVLAGRLKEAAGMLGRPFSLLGTVVPGRGLGRKLGIPTANPNPHNEVTPPDGVYIVRARWDSVDYPGIVNLGVRPTLALPKERPTRVLELHLFGLRRNLYGKAIEVTFLKKLRRERVFPSLEALQRQIRKDIERAKLWFEQKKSIGCF
jgi:riboflavin kinase/FMN adenylyltransferase